MRNTVFNYGIRIWGFVITFIIHYIVIKGLGEIRGLGPEEYGIYLLVASLTGYFGLLDLGIGTSLVKFVAEYHVKKEKEKVNEMVNTAFFIFLGIGIVGAVGLFFVGHFFMDVFKFETNYQLLEAKIIIFILGIAFLTSFSRMAFREILKGMQRYDILAYITFIMSLVSVGVSVWVLWMGFSIVEYVLFTLCFGLIGQVIMAVYVKKLLPYLDIKPTYLKRTMVRPLFGLSMLVLLLVVFNKFVFYTDNIVIGWWFVGTSMVTFYVIAHSIYSIPSKVLGAPLVAILPAASELDALQRKKTLQTLYLRVTKYSLALLFIFALPTLFMSKYILSNYMGSEYAAYYMVTNILIVSLFFDFFNYVSGQILIGINKLKVFVACYGVVAIMNLVLSILFVQHLGLEGVALGTAIPFMIMAPILMWNSFRILEINWKDFVKKVLFTNIPHACLVIVILFLLVYLHAPVNWIEIGIYYTISIGIYFLLFYRLSLTEEEKNDLKSIFSVKLYRVGSDET
jgi:O-antigen/teichoic acid export membrane protein